MQTKVVDLSRQQSDRELMSLADLTRLLRMLWRWKWLVLLAATAGLGAGYVYFKHSTPVYESRAQMLIVQRKNVSGVEIQSMPEDDASIHVKILKSPTFLQSVVDGHTLSALPSFAQRTNPTGAIVRGLSVSRDTDLRPGSSNAVLDLAFRGVEPSDCATVLSAVIDSYVEYLRVKTQKLNSSSLANLNGKITKSEAQIKSKKKELEDYRKKHSPTTGTFSSQARAASNRVSELDTQTTQLRIEGELLKIRLEHYAKLEGLTDNQAELARFLPKEFVAMKVSTSPAAPPRQLAKAQMEAKLYPLLLQQQQLVEEWGVRHPKVLENEELIQFTREFYAESVAEERVRIKRTSMLPDESELDPVQIYVQSLRNELQDITAQLTVLEELAKDDRKTAVEMAKSEEEERRLKSEIDRRYTVYDSLVSVSHQLSQSADYGGFTTDVLAEATRGTKVAPRRVFIMTMGLTMGLLAGLCLAILAENSHKSFRSPVEIQQRLNLPVLGHTPFISSPEVQSDSAESAFDPIVQAYYKPQSTTAESFRGVRAAIFATSRTRTCQIIQVASPNIGDGKSSFVVNLAVSMAQSGKSVLLIDADLRRPSVGRIMDLSEEAGLAQILANQIECVDVIQPSGITNLDILPGGGVPTSPADLITSPKLKEAIDYARERYDYVLVDTPALLMVTDGIAVAPLVDEVILVIRITKNGRPDVEHSVDMLMTVQARILGVVVNSMRSDNYDGLGRGYSHGKFNKGDHVYFSDKP